MFILYIVHSTHDNIKTSIHSLEEISWGKQDKITILRKTEKTKKSCLKYGDSNIKVKKQQNHFKILCDISI